MPRDMTLTGSFNFRIASHRERRVAVYTRDAFHCQVCGWAPDEIPGDFDGRFTLSGRYPHPSGDYHSRHLHLDHIIPRCAGGTNALTNLRTLCNSCNSVKATADKRIKL